MEDISCFLKWEYLLWVGKYCRGVNGVKEEEWLQSTYIKAHTHTYLRILNESKDTIYYLICGRLCAVAWYNRPCMNNSHLWVTVCACESYNAKDYYSLLITIVLRLKLYLRESERDNFATYIITVWKEINFKCVYFEEFELWNRAWQPDVSPFS